MNDKNGGVYTIPGLEFAERVGQAFSGAMSAQQSLVLDAWNRIRKGEFTYADMLQTWSQAVSGYYDVMVELSRGPGFLVQPVWLYFDYQRAIGDRGETPETLRATVRIARTEAATTLLDATDFAGLGGAQQIPAGQAYASFDWAPQSRSQIMIALAMPEIRQAAPGDYVSFMLPKGRTSEPPLVVVALRIR